MSAFTVEFDDGEKITYTSHLESLEKNRVFSIKYAVTDGKGEFTISNAITDRGLNLPPAAMIALVEELIEYIKQIQKL